VAELCALDLLHAAKPGSLPNIHAIGFASPAIGNQALSFFVQQRGWKKFLTTYLLPGKFQASILALSLHRNHGHPIYGPAPLVSKHIESHLERRLILSRGEDVDEPIARDSIGILNPGRVAEDTLGRWLAFLPQAEELQESIGPTTSQPSQTPEDKHSTWEHREAPAAHASSSVVLGTPDVGGRAANSTQIRNNIVSFPFSQVLSPPPHPQSLLKGGDNSQKTAAWCRPDKPGQTFCSAGSKLILPAIPVSNHAKQRMTLIVPLSCRSRN
jgi:hypothetical protein